MSRRKPKAPTPPAPISAEDRANGFIFPALPPGKTASQDVAELVAKGVAGNTVALRQWSAGSLTPAGLTDLYEAVQAIGNRTEAGDLGDLEKLLSAQVLALNGSFVAMMHRAKLADRLETIETYVRLGLRMQSQCRATVETLAQVKMPPVFAKQANITSGPQQVNNGGTVNNGSHARTSEIESRPSKLLEAATDGEWVDGGTPAAAARGDSVVETVDAIDRPEKRRRQGARSAERVQGRAASRSARVRPRNQ